MPITVAGDTSIDLTVDPGYAVGGHLADGHGAPVSGIALSVLRVGPSFAASAVTDVQGDFLLTLPPGTYTFTATRYHSPEGYAITTWPLGPVEVSAGRRLELALPGGARVRGQVRLADGRGVRARVSLDAGAYAWRGDGDAAATAETDAEGRYDMTLRPGTYALSASPAGGTTPVARVLTDLSLDGERQQDIVLPDARARHSLSGRVVWHGADGWAQVNLQHNEGALHFYDESRGVSASVAVDYGKYGVALPVGRYLAHVALRGPSGQLAQAQCGPLTVASDTTWDITVGADGTAVAEDQEARPHVFRLGYAYPNPFNGQTVIPFELPQAGPVSLVVYDILGQRVRELVRGRQLAGAHLALWDGRDAAGWAVGTGVYLCRLQAGTRAQTVRMLLLPQYQQGRRDAVRHCGLARRRPMRDFHSTEKSTSR
ncbi:MAG: carboxypeptidase regulatory-like domain-containing protein [Candidatus Latescibacterota bacterium]